MDSLLFLMGLLAVAWVLAVPVLVVLYFKQSKRLDKLRQKVERLDAMSRAENEVRPVIREPVTATEPTDAPEETAEEETPSTLPKIDKTPVSPPVAAASVANDTDSITTAPPKAFVFSADKVDAFSTWLKENWVLAAGAASLSLAGIFLVQYGVESGLLTPLARVLAALVFGMALLAGGEVIRRRFGGDSDGTTQFLPSALSGAGLLTLFAAVLAARVLYDLIGPGQTFAGLVLVSAIGVIFGWFYGPVLTAVGILGATATPYLIGGSSEQAWLLQYYFALIALTALAIDTLKRWAWVSVLALLATLASTWFIYLGTNEPLHFIAATLIIAAGAIAIPQRRIVPDHDGAPVLGVLWKAWPEFPTRLSAGVTVNAGAAALAVTLIGSNIADAYLGLFVMVVLFLATTLWMWRAPALADHTIVPVLAFLGLIATQALDVGPMYEVFAAAVSRPPETAPPATVWHLLVVAAIATVLTFWRIPRAGMPLLWAFAASSLAPIAVFLLDFLWDPTQVYGAYPWALAVIAIAALMTLLAERALRLEIDDKALITALFAVAAFSLIGLALFLLLTKTALTLALATMILLVTLLDRRFDLPLLMYYAMVGAAVITYRLTIDPGVDWAVDFRTSLVQVLLAYAGTMAILAAAWHLARQFRPRLSVILESTLWVLGAAFVLVLFERLLPGRGLESHWGLGLLASLWITIALAQVYRLPGSSKLGRVFRIGLAGIFIVLVLGILAVRFAFFNPLTGDDVIGVPFFSSLVPGYLSLALVLGLAAWKLPSLRRTTRIGLAVVSAAYVAIYIGLSIRHLWRGPDLSVAGFTDPEMYSYTVAMLLASAGLLFVAFWKRAAWLRKLAMAGIALTIAKVFFIDMSGLSGLLRVMSFMGLGLALLALTWLDRVMSAQWEKGAE